MSTWQQREIYPDYISETFTILPPRLTPPVHTLHLLSVFFSLMLPYGVQPTFDDVLEQNLDVLVPVGATVLVVEAEDVKQLVLYCPKEDATLAAQRHRLNAALSAHVGGASAVHLNEVIMDTFIFSLYVV